MDEALSIFRESRDYYNPLLPWGASGKELMKEFWFSLRNRQCDRFLAGWGARNGVPIRVVTLCSGSEAPMQALSELTEVYNDNLADDKIVFFF